LKTLGLRWIGYLEGLDCSAGGSVRRLSWPDILVRETVRDSPAKIRVCPFKFRLLLCVLLAHTVLVNATPAGPLWVEGRGGLGGVAGKKILRGSTARLVKSRDQGRGARLVDAISGPRWGVVGTEIDEPRLHGTILEGDTQRTRPPENECGHSSAGGVLPCPKRPRRGVSGREERRWLGLSGGFNGLRVRRGSLRTFTHPSARHFQT
jgi:hypothetical protein